MVLANFSVSVAVLSWLMSSLVAMTMVYPGDSHTLQPYPLRSQQTPVLSSAQSLNCLWLWVISVHSCASSHSSIKQRKLYLPSSPKNSFINRWQVSQKWEGKITYPLILHVGRLLTRAFTSQTSFSSVTTAAGGEMLYFSHIQQPVAVFIVYKCSSKNISVNSKCTREKTLKG